MRSEEEFIKEYFRRNGTVSLWWEPEEESKQIGWLTRYDRYIFSLEREDVVKILQPRGKHILEVGVGKGRIAIELARCGAKVKAIDISREMLKIASQRAKEKGVLEKIVFEEGDAERLKYSSDFFDAVVCIQTLMHVPNQQKCLNELARVVKSNGIVVVDHINKKHRWRIMVRGKKDYIWAVIDDIYYSTLGLPIRYLVHKILGRPLNPSIINRATREQFIILARKAGLKIERIIDYGPDCCPMYFLIVGMKT